MLMDATFAGTPASDPVMSLVLGLKIVTNNENSNNSIWF